GSFVAADENGLVGLISYLPEDFHLHSLIAVPMPMDDHIGGFIVLGRTTGQVSDDDKRLAANPPARAGAPVSCAQLVALTRGKSGVIGALCLGRRGTTGFSQQDVSALDDLGSMAGVAVENSRILQVVSGQASRLDVALDALGEVSAALTTVTQGSRVLEQKTLEAAIRVVDGSAGLLTRSSDEGHQVAIMSVGLSDLEGMLCQNG